MSIRTGRCLCGEVQYTVTADPLVARICWCVDCQKLSANGVANMLVPTEALTQQGKLLSHFKTADSGNTIERRFCANCGTHVFAISSARPQFTVVRIGTLDDKSSVKPAMNIWVSSAPQWACMDQALDRIERQPTPPPK